MNRLILILLFAPLIAFGQRVTDSLHLMSGDEVSRLESTIGAHPIYIETMDSAPGDLKAYADSKVQSLTANGKAVLIVVTIHPKAWRISEWPHGLVSVQAIGDSMATQFKRGQFFAGFNGAVQAIDYAVTHPKTAPPVVKTVTTTTTHTETHARPMAYRTSGYDPAVIFLFWFFGLIALFLLIWAIVEICTPRTVIIHDREDDGGYVPSRGGSPNVSPSAARSYYNQYSPAQRQAIANTYVGQPGYYPGIYRDPLQFYMLLMTMNALTSHPYYGYGYGMGPNGYMGGVGGVGSDIVTDTTTTTTTETSQADAGGAGGGWGSAPASRDDDSSGGGGSWSSPSSDPSPSSFDSGGGGSFDSGGSSGGGDSSGGGGSW